jgi:hypothetical protein
MFGLTAGDGGGDCDLPGAAANKTMNTMPMELEDFIVHRTL